MYQIITHSRLSNDSFKYSIYSQKFFNDKKEAESFVYQLAKDECNKLNFYFKHKYILSLGDEIAPATAIISVKKPFFTLIKRYYVEQINDENIIENFFDSIFLLVAPAIYVHRVLHMSVESCLFEFENDVINLIKPYLYNSRTFDVIDMDSDVKYWIDTYKNEYTGDIFIKKCCEGIVFNLLCIIDGISPKNDFKMEKTTFDEALHEAELPYMWCEYLQKNK